MQYESTLDLHNALIKSAESTKEHVDKHVALQDHVIDGITVEAP